MLGNLLGIMATNKNWYKVGDIEYSTNFRFFLEHQVFTDQKPHEFIIKVISRLDGKQLGIIEAYKRDGSIEDINLKFKLKEIHQNILNGEVYDEKGIFTN